MLRQSKSLKKQKKQSPASVSTRSKTNKPPRAPRAKNKSKLTNPSLIQQSQTRLFTTAPNLVIPNATRNAAPSANAGRRTKPFMASVRPISTTSSVSHGSAPMLTFNLPPLAALGQFVPSRHRCFPNPLALTSFARHSAKAGPAQRTAKRRFTTAVGTKEAEGDDEQEAPVIVPRMSPTTSPTSRPARYSSTQGSSQGHNGVPISVPLGKRPMGR